MDDYISRADAIEAVCGDCSIETKNNCKTDGYCYEVRNLMALPSADADGEDLIIKGAKGIQDGLYNIKDGKLFKYKANGGTVRTYPIVPSADAVQGEWEDREVFNETDDDHIVEEWQSARCSVCGKYHTTPYMYYFDDFNFCPNCGARMKGGAE